MRNDWIVAGALLGCLAGAALGGCSSKSTGGTGGDSGSTTTASTGGMTTSSHAGSGGMTTSTSTGTAATTTGTGTGGVSTSTSTSTGTAGTGGGDGGGVVSACTELALLQCTQMKACAPHLYAQYWDSSDALCESEAVRLCTALPSTLDATTQGVVDPVACKAALSGSCATYLAASDIPPAACQPKPGMKTLNQSCLATEQCGTGLACYYGGPSSCPSYCGPVGTAGKICGNSASAGDGVCDPRNGLDCVIDATGINWGPFTCTAVTRGALGAACTLDVSGPTAERCESGLACSSATAATTCVALLEEGATCTAGMLGENPQDPCDNRLGLSCQPLDTAHPTMGSTCQGPYVVPNGATCGMVLDGTVMHNHVCSNYSYCDSTSVCQPKAMEGQGCVNNGCYPPYVCTVGTCQAPTMQVDPSCNPVTTAPASVLACGPTPGGLPLVCAAGTVCCMEAPTPTDTTSSSNVCSTGSTCPSSANSELDCDDSSQCSSGKLCCLQYNPTNTPPGPPVKGVCTLLAACTGNNVEICRTDGTAPCGGGTCTPAAADNAHSDWTVFLPGDVGFCKPPTCVAPNDNNGCGASSDCCSGDCDFSNSPHENLCF